MSGMKGGEGPMLEGPRREKRTGQTMEDSKTMVNLLEIDEYSLFHMI